MDREADGWTEPRNLGPPVNTAQPEYFPAVTAAGVLYFTRADSLSRIHRIFRSRPTPAGFGEPELLPAEVNCGTNRFNATITPDESRLILSAAGVAGSFGLVDYFLVLRDEEDRWTGPLNLGSVINDGSGQSWSSYVTPAGGTFLFMSTRRGGPVPAWPPGWSDLQASHRSAGGGNPNIYQVRADFLDSLAVGASAPAGSGSVYQGATGAAGVPFPEVSGPYLGQSPPGTEPEVFAPGIVSTGLNERDILIHPDGRTVWYGFMGQGLVTILESRLEKGRWTEPEPVPFHHDERFACFEPTLSADGATVLFLSNRAAPGQEQGRGWANQNIFRSRRVAGVWTEPQALPAPVTTAAPEYFPSLAADGTLYFSRENSRGQASIWFCEPDGDGFAPARRLSAAVNVGPSNFNATVAPDESWIILCVNGHPDNLGDSDYWISFRDAGQGWRPAVNLGPRFNGPGLRAASVSLSPDGRHLFFSTNRILEENFWPDGRVTRDQLLVQHAGHGHGSTDIWWVDMFVINELK
jgi:hypothetical protein